MKTVKKGRGSLVAQCSGLVDCVGGRENQKAEGPEGKECAMEGNAREEGPGPHLILTKGGRGAASWPC